MIRNKHLRFKKWQHLQHYCADKGFKGTNVHGGSVKITLTCVSLFSLHFSILGTRTTEKVVFVINFYYYSYFPDHIIIQGLINYSVHKGKGDWSKADPTGPGGGSLPLAPSVTARLGTDKTAEQIEIEFFKTQRRWPLDLRILLDQMIKVWSIVLQR